MPQPPTNMTSCGAGGLVPREAFRGDTVCVEPRVHDQTIADNIAAPSRTLPNGLCVRGYLWRRANPDDHVCVLPATREQAQIDNQRACRDGRCNVAAIPAPVTTIRRPGHNTLAVHPTRPIFRPRRPHSVSIAGPTSHMTTIRPSFGHGPVFRGGGFRGGGGGGFRGGGRRR
jgi:hypothetical protein